MLGEANYLLPDNIKRSLGQIVSGVACRERGSVFYPRSFSNFYSLLMKKEERENLLETYQCQHTQLVIRITLAKLPNGDEELKN